MGQSANHEGGFSHGQYVFRPTVVSRRPALSSGVWLTGCLRDVGGGRTAPAGSRTGGCRLTAKPVGGDLVADRLPGCAAGYVAITCRIAARQLSAGTSGAIARPQVSPVPIFLVGSQPGSIASSRLRGELATAPRASSNSDWTRRSRVSVSVAAARFSTRPASTGIGSPNVIVAVRAPRMPAVLACRMSSSNLSSVSARRSIVGWGPRSRPGN